MHDKLSSMIFNDSSSDRFALHASASTDYAAFSFPLVLLENNL